LLMTACLHLLHSCSRPCRAPRPGAPSTACFPPCCCCQSGRPSLLAVVLCVLVLCAVCWCVHSPVVCVLVTHRHTCVAATRWWLVSTGHCEAVFSSCKGDSVSVCAHTLCVAAGSSSCVRFCTELVVLEEACSTRLGDWRCPICRQDRAFFGMTVAVVLLLSLHSLLTTQLAPLPSKARLPLLAPGRGNRGVPAGARLFFLLRRQQQQRRHTALIRVCVRLSGCLAVSQAGLWGACTHTLQRHGNKRASPHARLRVRFES
jgi:hypothetical protein